MNERMFRFPSGWEWLQLRQPFEPEQALPSPDIAWIDREENLPASSQLPPRSKRQGANKAAAAGGTVQAEASQSQLNRVEANARLLALKQRMPECAAWLDDCFERSSNHIVVHRLDDGQSVLYGSLLIQQTSDKADIQPLRFWVTQQKLVTIHEDWRLSIRTQQAPWDTQLNQCATGGEAFLTALSALLEPLHHGLDGFEARLSHLEHAMRKRNRMNLMTAIFDRRYDLLHWSHLYMPIKELFDAMQETFVGALAETDAHIRLQHKLERIGSLLAAYAAEIDTLISMDDAISSFRGNDIMKTLTIFTVLFMPATIAGTLWGMNFRKLPWSDEPWGFIGMCLVVILCTAGIYLWFWRKGWTGDLLNTKLPSQEHAAKQPRKKRSKRQQRRSSKAKKIDERSPSTKVLLSGSASEHSVIDKPRGRS
ncbi:Mg2 transporter protein CorA family protein [Paenibacillus curdlanolyticus YK9]|uniref:Mg2 transporter protein CorA family protein n=1 Tax=Paenibacillus curdlanolyticus YK9 TaxID=717606 RepID=E0I9V4_9BACL|nr:magnesium transporter CorA family protein [Paenibacillus curdlanolyticus]EFM10531.1 Mg2 transporter protein CorA family protein [Paenibacillus curdlanolyticus YK9]